MATSGAELLADDGDVILVVGSTEERIRVCSVTLSRASRVFAALFGPHFREGQQFRNSSNPVEIELPDDAADDVTFICRALHFQAPSLDDKGPKEGAKKLLSLAIAVDKYALTNAFLHTAHTLMRIWLDSHEVPVADHYDIANVATAAYLFNEPHCFMLATRRLIRDTNAEITLLCTQPCARLLPIQVLVGISECRSKALNHISERIARAEQYTDGCDACCKDGLTYYDTLRNIWYAASSTLRRYQNDGSEYTITYHIKKLQHIRDDVYKYGEDLCYGLGCDNAIPEHKFWDIATEAEEKSTGFCLMCVKSNANVLEICKNQH